MPIPDPQTEKTENLRSIMEKRFYELKEKGIQPYAKFRTYKAYLKTKDIHEVKILKKPKYNPSFSRENLGVKKYDSKINRPTPR